MPFHRRSPSLPTPESDNVVREQQQRSDVRNPGDKPTGTHLPGLPCLAEPTPPVLPLQRLPQSPPQHSLSPGLHFMRCHKPVLPPAHGGCIGWGVDLITARGVRLCTREAYLSVKEVDVVITADLGTLQRLPTTVGYGNAFEMVITGRRIGAEQRRQRPWGLSVGIFLVSGGVDSKC
ncbi:hypothetical protein MLD38_007421 [Melastoma candidum]|uniref:Uncharacterized protein n=1 Tax=Melastoma candidum TaxID=119954 RepID=A0ACB9RQT0_9MYRT|nr:hypothetical protein MLD38_007421 [Melastoma candidum]